MRRFALPLILFAVALAPAAAQAGPLLELSLGQGWKVSPSPVDTLKLNVMLTPGYSLLAGAVKLELGLVGNMGDVQHDQFDLDLRPMIVLSPPFFPMYARAILAVQALTKGPVTTAWGGAVGFSVGIPMTGANLFGEVGALPRNVESQTFWVVEGRIGAGYEF